MKETIQNRKGQNVVLEIDEPDQPRGLAIVLHGLSGTKDEPHVKVMAQAFLDAGFRTVRIDATNSFNEAGGTYEKASVTNHLSDLEDAIAWIKQQPWYQEPFAMAGHSLGGIAIGVYAEQHPQEVLALAPISTVVSGALSLEARKRVDAQAVHKWQDSGWVEEESETVPGLIKRLPWSHMEDRLKYDLIPEADQLTMPVLMVVGDKDASTPPDHEQQLYDALPGPKEIHIIEGSTHTFPDQSHRDQLKALFDDWLQREVIPRSP